MELTVSQQDAPTGVIRPIPVMTIGSGVDDFFFCGVCISVDRCLGALDDDFTGCVFGDGRTLDDNLAA